MNCSVINYFYIKRGKNKILTNTYAKVQIFLYKKKSQKLSIL